MRAHPKSLALAAALLLGVGLAIPALSTASASPARSVPATDRIAGQDRYATAVEVSQAGFPGTAPVVFLATGTNYPDALAAGPAAAKLGGPLLLTPPTALPSEVSTEITRLHPSTVYIVGGTSSVSNDVKATIQNLSFHPAVHRLGGADRYATGRLVISTVWTSAADTMYVATGANFPDALSAAAAAGSIGAPVLLVNGSAASLDTPTLSLLTEEHTNTVRIAGGTSAVSSGIESDFHTQLDLPHVTRLAGADRYATSLAIAQNGFSNASDALVATGTTFPDALAGSALAGARHAPLLTQSGDCVPSGAVDEITNLGAAQVTIIGGTATVGEDVNELTPCTESAASIKWTSATQVGSTQVTQWDDISCPTSGFCVAITDQPNAGIATLHGTTWTTQTSPLPSNADHSLNYLDAVTCPTTSLCYATGSVGVGGYVVPNVVRYKNGAWTASSGNEPSDIATDGSQNSYLGDTACGSSTDCHSVGRYIDSSDHSQPLDEHITATATTGVKMPLPSDAATSPDSGADQIACTSVGNCVATGAYENTSGHTLGMIDTMTGGSWVSSISTPLPSGTSIDPDMQNVGLECASAGECVALVHYQALFGPSTNITKTAVVTMHDGSWTAEELDKPNGALFSTGYGLSCVGLNVCFVAASADIAGDNHAFVERTEHGSTDDYLASNPTSASSYNDEYTSISCTEADCTAFGYYTAQGIDDALVTHLGNDIDTTKLSTPPAGDSVWFDASSCSLSGFCVGLGNDSVAH